MILPSFFAALGQIGDPRFLRVILRGIGLSLALLVGIALAVWFLVDLWVPGSLALPFVGPVTGLHWATGIGVALLTLAASVFLMVPVAAAFSTLYLDEVAEAVEARHYPTPPGKAIGFWEGFSSSAVLILVILAVNLVALALSFVLGPFGPVLFWAVNGWFLGREYFLLAALRHLPRVKARGLMHDHLGTVWLAGTLMAMPLSLPLVSLVIPVLGAATFTHLFQRVWRRQST